jgi:hypothetical protein
VFVSIFQVSIVLTRIDVRSMHTAVVIAMQKYVGSIFFIMLSCKHKLTNEEVILHLKKESSFEYIISNYNVVK